MLRLKKNSMHESTYLKRNSQTKKNDGMYRFNVVGRLRPRRFKLLQSKQDQVVSMEVSKALAILVIVQSTLSTTRLASQRTWTQLRESNQRKLATLTGLEFRAPPASETCRQWWTWLGAITPLKVLHRTPRWPSLSSMATTTAEVCSTVRRNPLPTSTDRCSTETPYRRKLITKWAIQT